MTLTTATAVIDRQALVENFNRVKAFAPKAKVLAVLKANGYGHGLELIARALPQADAFGVARLDEALALRAAGVIKPIVLLEGFFSEQELPILVVNNLQTIIHNREQLNALTRTQLEKPLKVWLKVDTGMHRLGINPEEFDTFYRALSASSNVDPDIVLMSHLGCADDESNPVTNTQLALFEQLTQGYNNEKSLANSAGCYAWPQTQFDWIRPGLILYGVSPMAEPEQDAQTLGIKPVMTLQSSLIAVRSLKAGEAVGYGGAWISPEDTNIGVIAIGYGDGYPRHAENGTPVLVNGRRVPLVGRVSMDMITVDLGKDSCDQVGDLAILWGQGLPVEEIALHATTIPYELLCNITRRVQVEVV
ncbi:alanine racemase [Thalassomonas viridans]|uniref:Alanine racemase n=1 Tax=Thalassomonas viridans TaxID=137584 RepID=A0AAE9Z104_9GAMM|nr:alanine racemase [Thalassomonas viridans]WDE04645.1 alanine racemase [Thalassomonas viridans]